VPSQMGRKRRSFAEKSKTEKKTVEAWKWGSPLKRAITEGKRSKGNLDALQPKRVRKERVLSVMRKRGRKKVQKQVIRGDSWRGGVLNRREPSGKIRVQGEKTSPCIPDPGRREFNSKGKRDRLKKVSGPREVKRERLSLARRRSSDRKGEKGQRLREHKRRRHAEQRSRAFFFVFGGKKKKHLIKGRDFDQKVGRERKAEKLQKQGDRSGKKNRGTSHVRSGRQIG